MFSLDSIWLSVPMDSPDGVWVRPVELLLMELVGQSYPADGP